MQPTYFLDKCNRLSTLTIINTSLLFLTTYHNNSASNSLETEGSLLKLFLAACKLCPPSPGIILGVNNREECF